ncbi:MAG: hypothetical protein GX555_08000, partial [Actinomycetales bacterium]|nr:hypothetical protein [Actinomycetales bacterium]
MTHRPHPRVTALLALTAAFALAACSGTPASEAPADDASTTAAAGSSSALGSASTVADTSGTVFDASAIHEFAVEVDETEFTAMMETYASTGDKEWISGAVTIDGQTFENVGLKLKGNSSLRGATADTDPVTLPWRIELDEFVEGQNLDGYSDFVVRANNSETSLNEAVALDL